METKRDTASPELQYNSILFANTKLLVSVQPYSPGWQPPNSGVTLGCGSSPLPRTARPTSLRT